MTTTRSTSASSAASCPFARNNRALFDLMWRMTQFDCNDPDLIEQRHRVLRALDRGLRGQDARLPDNADPALVPSYAVWSLVHGFTSLALESAIDDAPPDPLTSDLLPAMLRLLDVSPTARVYMGNSWLTWTSRPDVTSGRGRSEIT